MDTYTAFRGQNKIVQGSLIEVVSFVKKNLGKSLDHCILIFNSTSGRTIDINFQGSEKEVLKRLDIYISEPEIENNTGPGRPKLGVVSREVSLLPRHWEWLATQSGGASAALRSLVEEARKKSANTKDIKQIQERTYRFMSVMAGDLLGYEEALRALYKQDKKSFLSQIRTWPDDIREYTIALAKPVFES